MIIKNYYDYFTSVNEGLIKTYDGNLSINHLIDVLSNIKFNVSGSFNNNRIKLTINEFNHIDKSKIDYLFDTISSILTNKFGWFPSNMTILSIYNMSNSKAFDEDEVKLKQDIISIISIEFDSKFDDVVDEHHNKLYHLSIMEYNDKILKYGLSPRSKSKRSSHIDRIYLCSNIEDCKLLIPQMKLYYLDERDINLYTLGNKKWRKDFKWVIYQIDNDINMKLYKDPRYINGYYTLENIDPGKIKIILKE